MPKRRISERRIPDVRPWCERIHEQAVLRTPHARVGGLTGVAAKQSTQPQRQFWPFHSEVDLNPPFCSRMKGDPDLLGALQPAYHSVVETLFEIGRTDPAD